jgi:RNA 2',3'-cyclic 3'-phosphodiesterase
MEQIRSFIAIELPENIKIFLSDLENDLKSNCPPVLKWVNPDNIHLTLKFLGNVDIGKIDSIIKSARAVTVDINPFSLTITQLGVFPNIKNIQVVWIGLSGQLDSLLELQKRLENSLFHMGFPLEKRPFTAHLTLARVSDRASYADKERISAVLSKSNYMHVLSLNVKSISLMKSQLARTGAIYSRLSLLELKSSCG